MTAKPPAIPSGSLPRPAASLFGPVAADIAEADRIFAATLAPYRSSFGPLIHHLRHYRGKRLRPALLLLAAKACGAVAPAHHTLAAAVEMIHTATLVHDDVLDEAEMRRCLPTVNAQWGNRVSILLGDMLFTHAFHLASTVDARACRIIGEATNRVCAGELRQTCERGNLELSEEVYFAIIEGKTAALTECCMRLGALYAAAEESTSEELADCGRSLGIAFQIADDLLDLVGEERSAGKTLGTDLRQQKLTLPVLHCLANLPQDQSKELRDAIASGEARGLRESLESTRSIEYARQQAEGFALSARRGLAGLPPSQSRAILESISDWCVQREK